MIMKKSILSGIYLFLTSVIIAQTAVLNVKEPGSSMKEGPVATYFLPQTVLEIEVEAAKTIRKAGPYAASARKYLGTPAEIEQNEEIWTITKINVKQKSEPDAGNQYKVYATAKSNAAFLSLTETGILRGINLPFGVSSGDKKNRNLNKTGKKKTEEKGKKSKKEAFVSNFIVTDSSKKTSNAAIAFEQINTLREVRLDILTQNTDVLHGKAVKSYLQEINKREAELIALFNGTERKETVKKTFIFYPDKEMTNQEIFRFSEKQGFVDSGNPVTITLKKTLPGDKQVLSGKGFVYRIPALTEIEIAVNKITFCQLGRLAYFPAGFFDKDTKALFDTQTGALLQVGK